MPTLLVVDDEPSVCYSIARLFGDETTRVVTAGTVAEGIRAFRSERPEVVVLDLLLPDGTGLQAFEAIRAISPKQPVVFITAHGTTTTAIEAMKQGAFDYLIKPLDFTRVANILRRAFEAAHLMQVSPVVPVLEPREQLVGRAPVIQEVCKQIGRVAPQDVNVLILGESGTGKELVARAVYHHSKRSDKPFLAINCAALPESLIESELFGHERGAFTGADRARIGKFEQCQDGTIFLDEIGDMPLAAQAKVLRLLQDQTFERVGGRESIRTHVRVIAATNQNLEKRIAAGLFRADLFYRLQGVTIALPALRDRPEDIAELAHHFLFLFNQELGLNVQGFDPAALDCLRAHRWPGNIRELQAVLKETMLRATGAILLPEFLPPALRGQSIVRATAPATSGEMDVSKLIEDLVARGENDLHARVVTAVERILFDRVLHATNGHLGKAAERLGLNRSTLRYKLRDTGLSAESPHAE
ncbi:response regulator with -like aaa-type and dna-binding domains : Response regulator with CheY-like receiver, AAA-type ATPase, and DNA-binding domains OS=Singulisphaera acidiphila (strain ATCC BAA-1392 / DSM 18658 / VKM B-2454 / MOB10) GN=Sinac_1278 PE=4 SV=1: Response_reg: Sigma54_activat: HTH_8 [Gemmata massiliana]|uniref:DNA-binding transcriptional regulator NtrC n=1 Tax=Gemmata massiliana TaxID=1210884 RepID=A0A6P2D0H6_9BACT|nr:sigma-54 dependent transcriptional regulator [Gemmata massiliana]VTR92960.1 response regulator with -like aaa-type and dna-binding domains : Response regulator with CheY-like receiver, AAA-type ATPase, and DNA-binding domains OS=Singulisphaera acidiphila (strain ATCC BAA-1392 / DSM 18658 / VKM B-2454 / MOB10) GN=Sinac_1278 PE=4 SV=1: Response_reg: Sigma54_activat: HTH_8 [Gemmata massiliana]